MVIPNEFPTTPLRRVWDTLEQVPSTLDAVPLVVMCDRWEVERAPSGEPMFVGYGAETHQPFSIARQQEAFAWLRDADWLDESPVKTKTAFPKLAGLLSTAGALTLATIEPDDRERFFLGADGVAVGRDGRPVPPKEVLRRNFVVPADGPSWNVSVRVAHYMADLVQLRSALLWVLAFQGGHREEALRQIANGRGRFYWLAGLDEHRADDTDEFGKGVARAWMSALLQFEPLRVNLVAVDDQSQLRFAFRPCSARQQMWLVLATTAGFIEPPIPVPGVFTCDYPPCGAVVVASRRAARGTHRFCSTKCGKAFHATRATKKKRQELRNV